MGAIFHPDRRRRPGLDQHLRPAHRASPVEARRRPQRSLRAHRPGLRPLRANGKTVAYNGGYGCVPGTFRVAGILQYRDRPQPAHDALRFYSDGTLIHHYGDFTQTGDFFPALQQLAGTAWQQVAAGGPDAYKVDCIAARVSSGGTGSAPSTRRAMDQGYGA
jgi:hypothetical protein